MHTINKYKINLKNIIKILVISQAILIPIQVFATTIFKLPTFIQLFYLYIFLNLIIITKLPIKKWFYFQKKFFLISFLFFLFTIILSIIVNFETTINKGTDFLYYISVYSPFWDTPINRLIWGLLNPILFFIYIFELFIILSLKDMLKIFIKSFIILAIISCIYSIYQFIAGLFDLPFSSIFSGHEGKEIYLIGKIRRVEGLFYEPGPHAAFLASILCILGTQIFNTNKNELLFNSKLNKIFLLIVGITLILTFSPIGILAYILFFISLLILNFNKIKHYLNIQLLTRFFVLLVIGFSSFIIFINRISNMNNFSIFKYLKERVVSGTFGGLNDPFIYTNPDQRSVRNYIGIQIFKDNLLLGCGPNNAILYFYKYAPFANVYNIKGPILRDKGAILNQHIKILCELGVLGFTFYMLILIYPFYLYFKRRKNLYFDPNKNLIQGLLIAHLIYILVSMQTTFQFYLHIFWFNYIPLVLLLSKTIKILPLRRNYAKI